MDIILPNRWRPRAYQRRLWSYLEGGGKRAVAVWHRRAGKDEVCLHWAACAAMQRVGNYWHMLPEASQARKAIWDAINPHTGRRRIDEAFPSSIRVGQRDDDMRIKLANGSVWQVVGADNFNSLVGSPPIGLVFSEYSLTSPAAWDYLRPIANFLYHAAVIGSGRVVGAPFLELGRAQYIADCSKWLTSS